MPGTLGDRLSFGEDLRRNAQLALDLAPIHCAGCMTYHMLRPMRRYVGSAAGIPDRGILVEAIGSFLSGRARAGEARVDILIAGAADSGLLAVCAHAAYVFLGAELGRVRFTVLDRCQTPLALCRDYADRTEVEVDLRSVDIASTGDQFEADFILMHNLLSFIDAGSHDATLLKLAGWLKPHGRIAFSTDLRPPAAGGRRSGHSERIREAIRSGVFALGEPMERFEARLESAGTGASGHVFDFGTAGQVHDLFRRTGLEVVQTEHARGTRRERMVAVLAASTATG